MCKLTLELKFRAQAVSTLNRSLTNEDEEVLAIKEGMPHTSTLVRRHGFQSGASET